MNPNPQNFAHTHNQFYDVIVIGAGAAGLMCAAQAGKRGRKVLVLEKANKVGKKILMSGGGKCNFTNYSIEPDNYICHNPHFVKSALSQYTQWDFIGLVHDYGIAYEERDLGKLFTLDGAKHILNLLLEECAKANHVDIRTSAEVTDVQKTTKSDDLNLQLFLVKSSVGDFSCHSLVIANGGLSIPTLGGSGIGYHIAKQFGHQIYPTRAGLVPFTFSDQFKESTEKLSGNAIVCTLSNSKASFTEPLLFTHRGLSGPSSLQLSNYWQSGETFYIDFLPQHDLKQILINQKQKQAKVLLRTILNDYFPKSIVIELQKLMWAEQSELAIGQWSDQKLIQLAELIHHYAVKPSGTEGYRTAEVTLGGVNTDEVSSKTMQSKLVEGLYFIGEVVDVTGHLGGYNFQWAWSSAYVAGAVV
uniref:NAD(P)/FAD-dependent oxidoreductase n=1 Tax=uncultured Acinetobacter sp. TaxID=165433 RepID=UPI00261A38E3|nr:NAD(P)/FAD-dependent oxidoreductase [uncultured Acinetobacter sp.]